MSAGRAADRRGSLSLSGREPLSPLRALAATTVAVFVADIVAMSVLELINPGSFAAMTLIDAVIMVALAFPILYVLGFRPMTALLEVHRAAQRQLEASNLQFHREVRERELAQDALERYARTQAALYAVAIAATQQLDLEVLASNVTDVVIRLLGADAGWVLLAGDSPDRPPRVLAARGGAEALVAAEASRPLGECERCGPWFREGLAPDESPVVAACPRMSNDVLVAAGFACHAGIMLRAGRSVLGTLNLAWRRPRASSETEESLLVSIAGQVGFALENALLYRAEKRAREAAETIRAASLAVTRTLDLEDVLTTLLDHLRSLVPYDRARVMLLEGDSTLRVRAVFADGKTVLLRDRVPTFAAGANPVVASILSSLVGIRIPDIHRHPGWGERMQAGFEHSWMGVPLVSGGAAIGLYSLSREEPDAFTDEDLRLAEALSAPASVAIDNARLFDEVVVGRERQQALSRRLVELQEDERRRVSRELHDGAGQALTSLLFTLRLLEREAAAGRTPESRIEELRRTAENVQETLHRVATGLRPAALDHVGLAPALRQLVEELNAPGGPRIVIETVGLGYDRLPPEVETAVYRVAQEALTNAIRHASAGQVAVVLEQRDGRLVLIVEDDGRGVDAARALATGRLGMSGMRERAEMLGGTFTVESRPGAGTTIVVEVPDGR